MQAKQWHYTSSQYGLSGYDGFQTRAKSLSISGEQQRRLESIGGYKRPMYANPDDVAIEAHPIAFRSCHLADNELAIVHSAYTGRDYSGRTGNFFAHGLICRPEAHKQCWAIDYYSWPKWVKVLTSEQDQPQDSYQLADTDIDPIESFPFSVLALFLNQTPSRLQYFKQMLQAVIAGKTNGRRLVLRCETFEESLHWLACIQKAFSLNYQAQLSFSSYQFEPQTEFDLNITCADTNFQLDESTREYQFYVFDFVNRQFSHIESKPHSYIDFVASCFEQNVKLLPSFYNYTLLFSHHLLDEKLTELTELYKIKLGITKTVNERQAVAIIHFINQFVRPQAMDKVADIVGKLAEKVLDSQDPLVLTTLCQYYISILADHADSKKLQQFWQLIITFNGLYLIGAIESSYKDSINELTRRAQQLGTPQAQCYQESLFSQYNINFVISHLDKIDEDRLQNFYQDLLSVSPAIDCLANDNFRKFILTAITKHHTHQKTLDWLSEPFTESAEALAQLIILMLLKFDMQSTTSTLVKHLHHRLMALNETLTFEVINKLLNHQSGKHFVLLDWILRIQNQHRVTQYDLYKLHVLDRHPAITNEDKSIFYDHLWQVLDNKNKVNIVERWFTNNDDQLLSNKTKLQFYHFVNDCLSLDKNKPMTNNFKFRPENHMLTEKFKSIFSAKLQLANIQLKPDMLYLRERVDQQDQLKSLDNHRQSQALRDITPAHYKTFLLSYFSPGLANFQSTEQHLNLLKNCFNSNYESTILEQYQSKIRSYSHKRLEEQFYIIVLFWWSFAKEEHYWCTNSFDSKVQQILQETLLSLKDNALAELGKRLKAEQNYKNKLEHRWNNINRINEERANTLLRKTLKEVGDLSNKASTWMFDKVNNIFKKP